LVLDTVVRVEAEEPHQEELGEEDIEAAVEVVEEDA
jgi:hypothetical protein